MHVDDNQLIANDPDYAMPVLGADGSLETAGAVALRESLKRGSSMGVSELLSSMDSEGMNQALRGAGFRVPATASEQLNGAIRGELNKALALKTDGFGLSSKRDENTMRNETRQKRSEPDADADFSPSEFSGDMNADAARVIQRILRSSRVSVELLGPASAGARGSLLLIAGQGLEQGIQGFGFDGLEGKYQVPLTMNELLELHCDAAQAVAEESARAGLAEWASGAKVAPLSEFVPDSVQKHLHGKLSLASAEAVVQAIEGGAVAQRAREVGAHTFTALLTAQGLDVNAKTIAQLAEDMGLALQEPDRARGKYFGPVVGEDHKASLVKVTRSDAMALPFAALSPGQERPKVGEAVSMAFKAGVLSVNVATQVGRSSVDR